MIIALFALAVAMIVGGLLAAILGWDIVLVERGWTMVIAGSVSAASGALLLGIAAAVSKLTDIQAELMRLHAGLNEEEPLALPSSPGLSLAALAGGLFSGEAAAAKTESKVEEQPTLPLFAEPDKPEEIAEAAPAWDRLGETPAKQAVLTEGETSSEPEPSREPEPFPADEISESKVPEFLLAERYRDRRDAEAQIPDLQIPDLQIPDLNEPLYVPEPVGEQPPDISAEPERAFDADVHEDRVAEPAPEPPAEEPAGEAAPEEIHAGSTIVGTYNSGDNKYIMFSDGSIEAQTPGGVFHFKSLDELKEFIASGGEGGVGSSAT